MVALPSTNPFCTKLQERKTSRRNTSSFHDDLFDRGTIPLRLHHEVIFGMHRDAIVELVGGKTLREQQSDNMRKFFTYCKNNFFIVVSNTQLVERWVKDSNECTLSGKDEHFSSLIGM